MAGPPFKNTFMSWDRVQDSGSRVSTKRFTTSPKDGTASGISDPRTTTNRSSPIMLWQPGSPSNLAINTTNRFSSRAVSIARTCRSFRRAVFTTVSGTSNVPRVDDDDWNDIPDAAREGVAEQPEDPDARLDAREGALERGGTLLTSPAFGGPTSNSAAFSMRSTTGRMRRTPSSSLFSDHGYHLGEKQRWSKFSLWERTTRVPLIISVPRGVNGKSRQAGRVIEHLSDARRSLRIARETQA